MLSEIVIINIATCIASYLIYKPIKRSLSILTSDYINKIEDNINTMKRDLKNLEKDKQELLTEKENFPSQRNMLLNKAKNDAQTLITNNFAKIKKNYDTKTDAINNTLEYRYNEICNNVIINCLAIITKLLSGYIKNTNSPNRSEMDNIDKTLLDMIKKEI